MTRHTNPIRLVQIFWLSTRYCGPHLTIEVYGGHQLFHFMKVLMELKDLTKSMTDLIKVAGTSWLGISALVLVLLTVAVCSTESLLRETFQTPSKH